MKKIYFTKMSGAGNDFIVVDLDKNNEFAASPGIVARLCARGTGIGADGVLTIRSVEDYDFESQYFNSDGSGGMLCGNGARCAVMFGFVKGITNNKNINFLSNGTAYKAELIDGETVRFFLKPPEDYRQSVPVTFDVGVAGMSYIFTGTDHSVIRVSDFPGFSGSLADFPVNEYGRQIRYSPEFKHKGTNVNFYDIKNGVINLRTYERGVEQETLACGTGAVATALVSYLKGESASPVKIITKSGRLLEVGFTTENSAIENVSLSGPAEIVFEGSFILEDFYNEKEQ